MVAVLGWILSGVEGIGTLVLWAGEELVDGLFIALVAAWNAAAALLPSMGDAPVLGTPTWLGWLNWAYPIGPLVAGLVSLVSMWVSFLAVRYILRLVRAV